MREERTSTERWLYALRAASCLESPPTTTGSPAAERGEAWAGDAEPGTVRVRGGESTSSAHRSSCCLRAMGCDRGQPGQDAGGGGAGGGRTWKLRLERKSSASCVADGASMAGAATAWMATTVEGSSLAGATEGRNECWPPSAAWMAVVLLLTTIGSSAAEGEGAWMSAGKEAMTGDGRRRARMASPGDLGRPELASGARAG